jgi:hypothetical protein
VTNDLLIEEVKIEMIDESLFEERHPSIDVFGISQQRDNERRITQTHI